MPDRGRVARQHEVERRVVERGHRVGAAPHAFHRPVHVARSEAVRALEEHVLLEVGVPELVRRLVAHPDAHEEIDRHDVGGAVVLHDEPHPVAQDLAGRRGQLGLGGVGGRPPDVRAPDPAQAERRSAAASHRTARGSGSGHGRDSTTPAPSRGRGDRARLGPEGPDQALGPARVYRDLGLDHGGGHPRADGERAELDQLLRGGRDHLGADEALGGLVEDELEVAALLTAGDAVAAAPRVVAGHRGVDPVGGRVAVGHAHQRRPRGS